MFIRSFFKRGFDSVQRLKTLRCMPPPPPRPLSPPSMTSGGPREGPGACEFYQAPAVEGDVRGAKGAVGLRVDVGNGQLPTGPGGVLASPFASGLLEFAGECARGGLLFFVGGGGGVAGVFGIVRQTCKGRRAKRSWFRNKEIRNKVRVEVCTYRFQLSSCRRSSVATPKESATQR